MRIPWLRRRKAVQWQTVVVYDLEKVDLDINSAYSEETMKPDPDGSWKIFLPQRPTLQLTAEVGAVGLREETHKKQTIQLVIRSRL